MSSTYTAHQETGGILFANKTISEAFALLPAGCRLISGNSNKKLQDGSSFTQVQAVYYHGAKGKITVTLDGEAK